MLLAVDTTTTVKTVGALLVLFGLVIVAFTVWYWRTAKPEPEALAPLEMMSARRFAGADPMSQQRLLDEVRPEGSSAPKETVRMVMQAVVMATQAEKIEAARIVAEREEREKAKAARRESGEAIEEWVQGGDDHVDDDLPTRANAPIDPLLG